MYYFQVWFLLQFKRFDFSLNVLVGACFSVTFLSLLLSHKLLQLLFLFGWAFLFINVLLSFKFSIFYFKFFCEKLVICLWLKIVSIVDYNFLQCFKQNRTPAFRKLTISSMNIKTPSLMSVFYSAYKWQKFGW